MHEKLDSLCGIIDVNALGQSGPTQLQHSLDVYAARWNAFGWDAITIDGHDVAAILDALDEARATKGKPTMILARTVKGHGVSFMAGKPGWHAKAIKKGEELEKALAELRRSSCRKTSRSRRRSLPRSHTDFFFFRNPGRAG